MSAIFLCDNADALRRVYSKEAVALIREHSPITDCVYTKEDLYRDPESFRSVRYLFSTWGMPVLAAEEIRTLLPSLECVFYAAGSVQSFARPFLDCGVRVFSAWAANGVPVAEYTLAQIILANKGFFAASRYMSVGDRAGLSPFMGKYLGNYGRTVGIIGAGMIGSTVIRMLEPYDLRCVVYDPFLPKSRADALGVELCSLEELFSVSDVVSNHLANNKDTRGILTGELFSLMKPYSTFINTGRGAQVAEAELCEVLQSRPDITAILDVTDPEPPAEDSPLYTLPNCIITPHIAGSIGDEVCRMSLYMAREFSSLVTGHPTLYEVTREMLLTMA